MKISNPIEIKPQNVNYATILWQVSDWCNFKCSYCNDFHNGGNYKNNKFIDTMLQNLEHIINLYKSNGVDFFKLSITGGEPTTWKGLIPLIEKFYDIVDKQNAEVKINTNLSRSLDFWQRYYRYFDIITASYHPEFSDKEQFLKNYKFLQDKTLVSARLMMHKDFFDDCISFSERIKTECYNYNIEYAAVLKTLSSDVPQYDYEEAWQEDFLKNNIKETSYEKIPEIYMRTKIENSVVTKDGESTLNDQDLVNHKINSFKGWGCDIYKVLFIDREGNINLATCGQKSSIGNIFSGTIDKDFMHSIICNKQWCHCGIDIEISKRKNYEKNV